jgi:hypothetical protein
MSGCYSGPAGGTSAAGLPQAQFSGSARRHHFSSWMILGCMCSLLHAGWKAAASAKVFMYAAADRLNIETANIEFREE